MAVVKNLFPRVVKPISVMLPPLLPEKILFRLIVLAVFLLLPAGAFCSSALSVCSFNIQLLGALKERHNTALAEVIKDNDIVVVQGLVSSPYPGTYPNGDTYEGNEKAAEFFDAMKSHGFQYILSEEDTGTGTEIHLNTSATEWWVAFYKPQIINIAIDLPYGFLDSDRSDNPNFERVPYAFSFRTKKGHFEFTLISVHLQSGLGSCNEMRRRHELDAIARWVDEKSQAGGIFFILGNMNIQNCKELKDIIPNGFISLNDRCLSTNTKVDNSKAYDHVMGRSSNIWDNIDSRNSFSVVDLVSAVRVNWDESVFGKFPDDPTRYDDFQRFFSDHHPVVFHMVIEKKKSLMMFDFFNRNLPFFNTYKKELVLLILVPFALFLLRRHFHYLYKKKETKYDKKIEDKFRIRDAELMILRELWLLLEKIDFFVRTTASEEVDKKELANAFSGLDEYVSANAPFIQDSIKEHVIEFISTFNDFSFTVDAKEVQGDVSCIMSMIEKRCSSLN
ncbi:MAG: hypothetical protein JW915_10540 [Chitinispirillaceae bacterium]|nr:hypothetical protein [Chitinispirillaceae bacterium]